MQEDPAQIEPKRIGTLPVQQRGCFLCAYADSACDVAFVEGALMRVAEQGGSSGMPVVSILTGDGEECVIVLPAHAKPLTRALAELPLDSLRELHLRAFHLVRARASAAGESGDEPRRSRFLRTTPASAI